MWTNLMAGGLLALWGSIEEPSHYTTTSNKSAEEYERKLARCAGAVWLLWMTTCAPRVMVRVN
jgi:hypothetical protein